ncbi:hypothetical protein BDV40DRAFT_121068 [Aspergillus tamarii]|uniref:Uncharacterized protein n=1 Tax=Aspergillus tamarii TaxID=41984 RepID=A0A5N6V0U9_ASPTM|nr:hypothetical protein BDV40DRAFT_121068 [Aspergillus tamarii]
MTLIIFTFPLSLHVKHTICARLKCSTTPTHWTRPFSTFILDTPGSRFQLEYIYIYRLSSNFIHGRLLAPSTCTYIQSFSNLKPIIDNLLNTSESKKVKEENRL